MNNTNKLRSSFFLGAFSVSLALAGCLVSAPPVQAQDVGYFSPAGVDFSIYKTYKWQRAKDARYPDDESDKILTTAIDIELAKKGFTKTDSDTADVYVIYQLAVIDGAEWGTYATDVPWQGGYHNNYALYQGSSTNTTTFIKVGWLTLDIYDVHQKKQIWQATARKTLSKSTDPKKRAKNAQKAMAKVFKYYPPPIK